MHTHHDQNGSGLEDDSFKSIFFKRKYPTFERIVNEHSSMLSYGHITVTS